MNYKSLVFPGFAVLLLVFSVGFSLGFWDYKGRLIPEEMSGIAADGWTIEVVTNGSSYALKHTHPDGSSFLSSSAYGTERKARRLCILTLFMCVKKKQGRKTRGDQ
jgi:hypothetical protein